MSEDLTGDQIALLCDIGQSDKVNLTEDKSRNLEWLISQGYVEPDPGPPFKLTAKAIAFLGKRGAGLNEA